MADPIRNFFKSTLVGTYSDSDTSLTVATGDGALLPDPSVDGAFNLTIFEGLQVTGSTEFEIVRVTARSGDVLTVTRGAESTTPLTIGSATHSILMSATKKTFDDINTAIANVDLTTLTNVESITYDNDGNEVFQLPAGTTAQRPNSPQTAYLRWNTDDERIEVYNGNRWAGINLVGFESVSLGVATATVTANDAVATLTGFISQFGTPASAFSVRQLGDTDVCMRVRRSNDNVEQNIGFTSDGDLDETALTTFVGANDGFVTTWYDQSVDNSTLPAEHGSGATASYSLRLVDSTYTGDAIRVRRSSDNTEQDIGFVDGELDTSTLETFCSGTNGFVTTWYDQSGSNNATQATAGSQPQIVSSGTTIKENGKPALDFDGSDDVLSASGVGTNDDMFIAFVADPDGSSEKYFVSIGYNSNDSVILFNELSTNNYSNITDSLNVTSSSGFTVQNIASYSKVSNNIELFLGGTSVASSASGTTISSNSLNLELGYAVTRNKAGTYHDGTMQEVIYYKSDQSSNREGIELNQASYYDIGVSIGATQSTAGSQPKIVSSGTVIKENNQPALDFDGSDDNFTFNVSVTQPLTVYSVYRALSNNSMPYGQISSNDGPTVSRRSDGSYIMFAGVVLSSGVHGSDQKISSALFNGGSSSGRWNGVEILSGNAGTNNDIGRIAGNGPDRLDGSLQEFILYNTNKSADTTDIESNISDYFNITI